MKKPTMPESKAVREVRGWRRKVQRRAEQVGWGKFLEEANRKAGRVLGAHRMSCGRSRPNATTHDTSETRLGTQNATLKQNLRTFAT